jgi:hypothetical protein
MQDKMLPHNQQIISTLKDNSPEVDMFGVSVNVDKR